MKRIEPAILLAVMLLGGWYRWEIYAFAYRLLLVVRFTEQPDPGDILGGAIAALVLLRACCRYLDRLRREAERN